MALSVHIVVHEQSVRSGQNVLRIVNAALASEFGITHTTLQVEVEGCAPDELYCVMKTGAHAATHDQDHKPNRERS